MGQNGPSVNGVKNACTTNSDSLQHLLYALQHQRMHFLISHSHLTVNANVDMRECRTA